MPSNNNEYNRVHQLCFQGELDTIKTLLRDPNNYSMFAYSDPDGNTSLHLAIKMGHYEIADAIIDKLPHLGNYMNVFARTPLFELVDQPKMLLRIVNQHGDGLSLDTIDYKGNSILKRVIPKVKERDDTYHLIMNALLDHGANPNIPANSPPIISAVQAGSGPAVKTLLEHGVDVNAHNRKLESALGHAVYGRHRKIVKMLVDAGIDINYRGHEAKNNPIDYCLNSRDFATIGYLLENGYDINNTDYTLNTDAHRIIGSEAPSELVITSIMLGNMNAKDINGDTPLHILIQNHDWNHFSEAFKMKPMNPLQKNKMGKMPLEYVPKNQRADFLRAILEGWSNDPVSRRGARCGTEKQCTGMLKKLEKGNKIDNKVTMMNPTTQNFGRFSADYVNGSIYLVKLLEKHSNLFVPFQYYNDSMYATDTNDRCFITYREPIGDIVAELTNIYINFCFELAPSLVVWVNKNIHYFHPRLRMALMKPLFADSVRFIYVKLSLVIGQQMTHANTILIDKETGTVERFEPYGRLKVPDSDIMDLEIARRLQSILGKWFAKRGLKMTYLCPDDFLPDVGFQTMGNDGDDRFRKLGDPGGYCLAWSLWWIESRINNPDLHPKELVDRLFKKILDKKIKKEDEDDAQLVFNNYIRSYSHTLDKMKNEFMENEGFGRMKFYSNTLTEKQTEILSKGVVSKLNQLASKRIG